jgi:hypothetical protein
MYIYISQLTLIILGILILIYQINLIIFIIDVVINLLLLLDLFFFLFIYHIKVSAQLSRKASGTPTHSESFWQLLQICINHFPQSFVGVVHRVPTDNLSLNGENIKHVPCTSETSKGKDKILSYFKTLSVGPGIKHERPMLNQLSQPGGG